MKRCGRCKKLKDEAEFNKDSYSKDGLRYWCRKCVRDYDRRKYRKKKGGHVKRYFRYEESHRIVSGIKEKRCSCCRKWRAGTDFRKDPCHKDGLAHHCKKCEREHSRTYYGYSGKYLSYEQRHRVVGRVKQKRCSKCKKWKAVSEFYKKSALKDGLAAWCKPCSDKATNKAHKRRLALGN